jgi:L-alanine-DL-glutamate epimerase-like enolase superfamily enzyme
MPKITNVRPFVIETPPPHKGGRFWYFVKLETDSGLEGWGETAILSTLNGLSGAYMELVRNIFTTYLKGEDALDREYLYSRMYSGLTYQHPDYVMLGVISAFDTALWDIAGKHFRTPVYNLLGGKVRDRIRSYTYIYDPSSKQSAQETVKMWTQEPERLAEVALKLVEQGFTGLKFDPLIQDKSAQRTFRPWDLSPAELGHAERAVGAIRAAVGERADILIGTHGQTTPAAAIRLAARLEQFSPLWLEEPCPPENYSEMGMVARSTRIPIASGERLVTVHEFQQLFAEKACAVAQPDLGSAGGITATKKIATLAEANYVLMAPHVWGGPIITAAALQIDANVPNFLIQESIGTSGEFFDEIIRQPFVWDKGDFIVPDRPGIGIELDEKSLEKHLGGAARSM